MPTTVSQMGFDERFNQTLKSQLQKLVNDRQDDWDELLDNILFAYRTSHQDSTKCTPFLLMYGREARLPIDVTRVQESHDDDNLDLGVKVQKMLELQEKLHEWYHEQCEMVLVGAWTDPDLKWYMWSLQT